jgi:hypothetical protein
MSSMYGAQRQMANQYGSRGNQTGGMGNRVPEGYELGRIQQFTPEMMQLFQSLFGHLGPDSFLSKIAGGDQEAFAEMERPALQQFTGEIGNLASRFSGMGMGARHSSGFQNAATGAASDFSQKLQSQRLGLQRQALGDLFGMSNMLLGQRPYDQNLYEKPPSFWESLLGGLGGMGGMFGGSVVGGLGSNLANKWTGR